MPEDAAEVRLILNAIDNASKTISGVTGKLSTFSKIAKGGQDMAAGLGINLNALSNPAMAAGQGIKMVGDYVKGAIDDTMAYTQTVKEMSMTFAAAPEEISRMIQAGDDMGVTLEEMRTSMQFMNRNGLAPTIDNLAALADRTNLILDPTKRADELVKLLGRSYTKLDPLLKQGGDSIRALAASQSDALVVTQAEIDASERNRVALDTWEDSLQSLKYTIGNAFIPIMADGLEGINAFFGGLQLVADAIADISAAQEAANKLGTKYAENINSTDKEIVEYKNSLIDASIVQTANISLAKAAGEQYRTYSMRVYDTAKAMDEAQQAADRDIKALNDLKTSGENVAGVMADQYYDAINNAAKVTQDQAIAANQARDANIEMFDSINTGLDSMIEKFMSDMEWLQGGGKALQDEFAEVSAAWIQDPGDPALKKQMEDLFIKTEALNVALGKIDATTAAENISKQLGIPFSEALSKVLGIKNTLIDIDGMHVNAVVDIEARFTPAPLNAPKPKGRASGGAVFGGNEYIWQEPGYQGEVLVPAGNGYVLNRQDAMQALSNSVNVSNGGGFQIGSVNIYAAPGQNGAQLYDEFVREARKRQNSGAAQAGRL